MLVDQRTGQVLDIIKQNEDGRLVVAKEALKQAMEEHGVEKIQTDNFTVSYVAATERVSLDTKAVEQKYPEVYYDPDCQKVSDVKASVRVRLK